MQDFCIINIMNLDNLRNQKLVFKDTFIYLREVFLCNYFNFLKLLLLWILFSFSIFYGINFLPEYLVALSMIFAYIVFYLFYLAFILQSRLTIDNNKIGIFACLKEVAKGFFKRKGLDLIALIPVALIVFLTVFFPSSIFAIPLAFIITLAMIIFSAYTVFTQPVLVIKKMTMFAAIRYAISLMSGYFTFVLGLIITFAFACLILYIPLIFIKTSLVVHQTLVASLIGAEVMLFAIMLTIIYTNLEIAWSVGFKNYEEDSVLNNTPAENNHEFTEFFNRVPEVQIKEDAKEDTKENENKNL